MADGALAAAPLSARTREALVAAGFRTLSDVTSTAPSALAREMRVDTARATEMIKEVMECCARELEPAEHGEAKRQRRAEGADAPKRPELDPRLRPSVLSLLEASKKRPGIVTFCRGLDSLLGGGIPVGEVTEIVGVPGVGKTQLCMQAAVDATLPAGFGGVDGHAVYIDTEGSFAPDRCAQMAGALHRHVRGMASRQTRQGADTEAAALTPDAQMARIHVIRCTSLAEQIGAVLALPSVIGALEAPPPSSSSSSSASAGGPSASPCPRVRLVVVDSIAFHYRGDASSADAGQRSRQLAAQAQALHALASERDLAVVVVNHVTTRLGSGGAGGAAPFGAGGGGAAAAVASAAMSGSAGGGHDALGGGSRLVPALGDSWAHACTNRLLLYWAGRTRVARLAKSPSRPLGATAFAVTAEGIRRARPGEVDDEDT